MIWQEMTQYKKARFRFHRIADTYVLLRGHGSMARLNKSWNIISYHVTFQGDIIFISTSGVFAE